MMQLYLRLRLQPCVFLDYTLHYGSSWIDNIHRLQIALTGTGLTWKVLWETRYKMPLALHSYTLFLHNLEPIDRLNLAIAFAVSKLHLVLIFLYSFQSFTR